MPEKRRTPYGDSLKELVCQTDYSEVMAMEQELIAEGMPVEEIQWMCDLHSRYAGSTCTFGRRAASTGHRSTRSGARMKPGESIGRLQQAMNSVAGNHAAETGCELPAWRQALNELQDVEKHYQRKEHLLFSCLERHGIAGPSKVMWGKDDQIRQLLKAVSRRCASAGRGGGM